MQATPMARRLHIGLFGRRNVGKSSLLNAITRQQVADALVTMSAFTSEGVGDFREMLSRIHRGREAGVPITNDGLTIACSLGIVERALAPFPFALEACHAARS